MAFEQRSLDDYVDVAERIADFRAKYPEGTLQPADPAKPWEQAVVNGVAKDGKPYAVTMIVYTAAAYRTPDDVRPGIGIAWEVFPGRTPFTLGSELQNAETSAWGRAIIAVGASDSKRGIASREEVRNRQAEREDGLPVNKDGSLSRSRTTDEQKDAAGVMTDAQQRAHNALERDTQGTGPQGTERIRIDDPSGLGPLAASVGMADPWLDGPAGLTPQDDPEDRHGTATADQITALQAAFTAKGIKERPAKIVWLADKFGPDIHSSKDLSYSQAARALQELR